MTLRLLPALPGIVYPVKKTPVWMTDVQEAVSGRRTALQRWSFPLYAFELGYEFLRFDTAFGEYQDLLSFFNLAGGRASLWRFEDVKDKTAVNQVIGIGDGVTTEFQLVRAITGLTLSWVDPVFSPTSVAVYLDGVLVTSGVFVHPYGVIAFSVAPAAGKVVSWTGGFEWLCRFDDDSATFEQFTYNLFELKVLKFRSEKP